VSGGLAMVLEKMVAQQPNERYKDGMLAMDAVEQLLVAHQPQLPTIPSPAAPTKQSQSPTQKAYVSPAAQTVKVKNPVMNFINRPDLSNPSRRKLVKQLWFGGLGVIGSTIGVLLSKAFSRYIATNSTNSSENATSSSTSSPSSADLATASKKDRKLQALSKISFTSVRLDNAGKILDKPTSSAIVFQENLGNGVSMTMVKIPAGKFIMGSPAKEKDREQEESPQHQVILPEFFLGQTLVTQAQWQALMGKNPSQFKLFGRVLLAQNKTG
jgi:eukaryotic-like serine/threonine-protein kinase